ncbi:MAG: OprO/OprP family phosphate-selective porin, partial [Gemmataceae bacterium]
RDRIGIEGYLYDNFYFRARYDFANANDITASEPGGAATTGFKDVLMRVEHLPFISNFQVGLWKEMINLVWQSSSNQIIFMERAAVINALNPGRTDGVATYRTYFNDRLFFGTGLFRSVDNNGGFSQGDGGWASTSRIAFLPIYEENGRYLVHLGGSYSHRAYNHTADSAGEPRFATVGDIAIGTPAVLDTGRIKGASNENLLNGEFVTLIGPLSIQSETMMVSINTPHGSPVYWGTYAQVSYFLTGENRRYRRSSGNMYGMSFTTPNVNENFFTLTRWPYIFGRGAWEIAARYDYLDLSGGGFVVPTASDGSGGTGRWNGMTYGLNWWLNDNSTIMLDYVHGWRHSDTPGRSGQM